MTIKNQTGKWTAMLLLGALLFVNTGCAALWFTGGAAAGVAAAKATDKDDKVVVVHDKKE